MKYLNIAVDSMTVLTPMEFFNSVDVAFYDEVVEVNTDTAEILRVVKKPLKREVCGISAQGYILNLFGKSYMSLTYNSKMLKSDYLQGIHIDNFKIVFDYVKSLFNIDIDYHLYLSNSVCNDVDFKADFYASEMDFEGIIKYYSKFPSAKTYFSQKKNFLDTRMATGLQFVNRNDASVRSPFVKFYSKLEELQERSNEFYCEFLLKKPLHELRRLEVTVKNKSHFESLNRRMEKVNSLENVLGYWVSNGLGGVIFPLLDRYTMRRPHEITKVEEGTLKVPYTPTDSLIMEMATILMRENNFTFNQILSFLDSYPAIGDATKSRIKTRLKRHFKEFIHLKSIENIVISPKDAFLT